MLVFTIKDLENLVGADELAGFIQSLDRPGKEIILYTCPHDRLYFGYLSVSEFKTLDFDKFVPSSTYVSVYHDLPNGKVAPCPLCGSPVSTVRIEFTGDALKVFSG